ncbi:hypothetical protein [Paenibacillus sp. AN1007]|uniref:Uncharacterized protein n=1 Tax=Paenibacillus sp. AN1007 TaxID=3151385 RepID=A0AAU8N3M0_9BACL
MKRKTNLLQQYTVWFMEDRLPSVCLKLPNYSNPLGLPNELLNTH